MDVDLRAGAGNSTAVVGPGGSGPFFFGVPGVLTVAWAISRANGAEWSGDVLATTAGSLAVLAVLTWWCGAHAAVRQSNRWRPHGE
ncbi:hypothetical protein [Streptomyces sp. NPDC101393]|uniref:hypothetical protein n=1 Tax=Streptomyces sp. NPDC101393 TaxID=3366141 RepID=UPI0038153CEE